MRSRSCSFFYVLIGLALAIPSSARGFEEPEPNPTVTEAGPAPVPHTTVKETAHATIPFDLYEGYLIVVHGRMGPLKNLNFFLDTGATPSVLDSRIAGKLHLENEAPSSILILGGRAQGGETTLPSVELGPIQRTNLHVATADLSFLQKRTPYRIDAIVGLDVLGQSAFVIDYAARVIRFGPPPSLAVSLPLRLDRGLATVDAAINNVPVHLMLDTGASSMILFEKATPAGGSSLKPDPVQRTKKDTGEFEQKSILLHTLRLGGEEFRVEPALVVHNPKQTQLDFDGLMSPAALGITRLSIDLARGEFAFSH